MISDGMPCARYLANQVRVPLGCAADHKERGPSTVGGQNVEQSWRELWMWAIVECQSHHQLTGLYVGHGADRLMLGRG
jgi:hypothetical protein